jgi:hypothetical protein
VGVTGHQGVDVRATPNRLIFRALLQNSAGALVTAGTTSLYLYEVQDDASLKSYDFNSNTFKSTALTTETASMTHRQGNNSTTDTGLWTYALTTVSGFTATAIYLARVKNTGASPFDQVREFQFGGAEGDLQVTASSFYLKVDTEEVAADSATALVLKLLNSGLEKGTAQAGSASGITLRAGASATNNFYKDMVIVIYGGTGSGQTNHILSYNGTSKVCRVKTPWATQPDNTSLYIVLGRVG